MKVETIHQRGLETSYCVGFISNVLPETRCTTFAEGSPTGVSTNSVLPEMQKNDLDSHWFALRTTYGREKKAYDYLVAKGIDAFLPTITEVKMHDGKRKIITSSRLPNLFFAYGSEEQIKTFVYDNVNLPFLRFYYRHLHIGNLIKRVPMVVPDSQINSLKIICESEANDVIMSCDEIDKFKKGELVRIVEGKFKAIVR